MLGDKVFKKVEMKKRETEILERAEAYIEQNRKEIINFDGLKPNTEYEISMKRHEFPFGTSISFTYTQLFTQEELLKAFPQYEVEIIKGFQNITPEQSRKYLEVAQQFFSGIVSDNQLKWASINLTSSKPDWFLSDRVVEFVRTDPLLFRNFRAHTVMWNRRHRLPEYLKDADQEEVKREALKHLEEVFTRYPDISEWDIINEPLRASKKVEGGEVKEVVFPPEAPETMDFYVDFIKRAHELAPNTRLYINEYDILTGMVDEDGTPKIDKFVKFMTEIKGRLAEEGVPMDKLGIGIQGHFWGNVPSIPDISDRLNRIAELGSDIKITEFDIDPRYFKDGDVGRAGWMTKAFTVFYGCPNVKGIYIWGFYHNWRGKGIDLVDDEFNLNTAGQAYLKKVYKDWGTHNKVTTDAGGKVQVRGFPGEYDVREINQ